MRLALAPRRSAARACEVNGRCQRRGRGGAPRSRSRPKASRDLRPRLRMHEGCMHGPPSLPPCVCCTNHPMLCCPPNMQCPIPRQYKSIFPHLFCARCRPAAQAQSSCCLQMACGLGPAQAQMASARYCCSHLALVGARLVVLGDLLHLLNYLQPWHRWARECPASCGGGASRRARAQSRLLGWHTQWPHSSRWRFERFRPWLGTSSGPSSAS
jgi:hypothetical protein